MKKNVLLSLFALFATAVMGQTSGGPDAYGYTWKNSNHGVTPPVYSWVDITARGIQVTGLADDNVVGPFAIPSGFQFYWYPITQFWVGSNGYVSFNGANIASPFPASIPSPAGSNDWVAPHMSDLNFSGAANPGQCWYYSNNDSLIISYINVPYWVVAAPGYSGSNTFQIIFSSVDNSITFNYQSMNAGTTPLPIDNAVGIENNTGVLGLQTLIDVVPGNLFTIKYYYPPVVTYAVTDGGINWNNNERNGGYFVRVSNQPITLRANVKNFGNQNLPAFSVTDTVYSGTMSLSNGSSVVPALIPGQDTTITFSNNFISQFPSIYTFASRVQGITGDMVQVNNRKTQKIISVNTNQAQYTLDYSDGVPDGAGLSWNGGNGGIGVYIEPPVYPIKIDATKFHITANAATPVGFSAMIFDDNGLNGGPGTLLDSVYVAPSAVTVGTYNTVQTANSSLYVTSGGVYIVWYMGGAGITLSRDITPPISAQSYEILGNAWGEYRSKLTEDFLMGMVVSSAPVPVANFSIDSSAAPLISFTDLSTNTPTSWHWDFGFNNDTSVLQNPSYTYTTNGTYTVCLTATNSLGSGTSCKTVRIRNIGLEEEQMNRNTFIYPNPAGERALLNLPAQLPPNAVQLRVYNLYGQLMNVPVEPDGMKLELNTSRLIPGLYFYDLLKTETGDVVSAGKFLIER